MCFKKKIKNIETNLNISSKEIIFQQKFKKGRIYLGTKVKIPRNFSLIITSNKKSLDILYEDEIVINLKLLPNTTKKFSLYRIDKKGRGPKYFEAEAYFVNLNVFEKFGWETVEYLDLEDRKYGEYKASCFGDLIFRISNPIKFLDYILNEANDLILNPNQAEKILKNFINKKIVRIINKINPLAKDLYLKDKDLIKIIYEKLSNLLNEIGVDLYTISLIETRFPPKILSDLKNTNENPTDVSGWGKMSFEEWQTINPAQTPKKPKFITIIPTGNDVPFFKESMAPYFFDEKEIEEDKKENAELKSKEPVWKGVDEKILEENSKKLVDLEDIDTNN